MDTAAPAPAVDPAVVRAIKRSIKHWRENRAAKHPYDASVGPDACALCEKFYGPPGREPPCVGCPVRAHTGQRYCKNTPYEAASNALDRWRDASGCGEHGAEYTVEMRKEWRRAALGMVRFLVSLLPEKESPIPEGENQ